jgi:predicted protein tyrosine phosphatase
LLFICSRNRWRSPTAEALFQGDSKFQAKSAGTETGARRRVTPGLIGWADIIFTMEKKHSDYLQRKFPDAIDGKRIICLRIPDEFGFNDPGLIDLLHATIHPHLEKLP